MKGKKLLAGIISAALVLCTIVMPAFAENKTIFTQEDFEAALSALNDNDTLILNSGSYTIPDTVTGINKSITIKGQGKDSTTLTVKKPLNVQANSFDLANLKVDGSALRKFTADKMISYSGKKINVENVDFYGGGTDTYGSSVALSLSENGIANFVGSKFSGATRAVQIWSMKNSTVEFDNCNFAAELYTLNVDGSQAGGILVVKNSVIAGWTSYGEVEKAVFISDTFNASTGAYVYNYVVPYADTYFEDCDFNFGDGERIEAAHDYNKIAIVNSRVNNVAVSASNMESVISSDSPVKAADVMTPVAKNGLSYYETLADAVKAAKDGETVKLLEDSRGDGIEIASGSNLTIDFQGHEYILDNPLKGSEGTKTNGFWLLRDSTIVLKNGTLYSTEANILVQNYANLTLDSMKLSLNKYHSDPNQQLYTLSNNNGKVVLTGDTTISALERNVAFDVCRFNDYPGVSVTLDENMTGAINGKIEISGNKLGDNPFELIIKNGTVNGAISNIATNPDIKISGGTFSENVSEYCADGFIAEKNEDGKYAVKALTWATDTDSGYYMDDTTPYGMMRFMFKTEPTGTIKASGIKYINASDIAAKPTVNGAVNTTKNSNVFQGDIVKIQFNTPGTYYARAFITTENGTFWSAPVGCSVNWNQFFTDYTGGEQ